jgi:hypothetical protein
MKPVIAYIAGLFKDPIFLRACMFLWGLPFVALGFGVAVLWQEGPEGWEWLALLCLLLVGAMGLCLLYVSALGSDATFNRTADFMSEGGDLVGLILVVVVVLLALPITAVIRALFPRARQQ